MRRECHMNLMSLLHFCNIKAVLLRQKFNMKHLLILAAVLLPLPAMAQSNESAAVSDDNKEIPAKAYFKNGKLHVATSNDKFKIQFDNRVYTDLSFYTPTESVDGLESKPNDDLEEDDGKFRFNNGVSIRRARFGVKATLFDNWFAEFDVDFAYNEVELKDMYAGYKFNDHWSVQAGHFKEPMSMERLTSSRYIMSNERPMPVEMFAGGRRLGIAATAWGNHWWASGGVFGQQVDILQKEKNRGSDGYSFTGRVATSPVNNDDLTLHLGGYATYRTPDGGGKEDRIVEFRTFPESRTDRRRFVRAEIPNANHYATYGLEVAVKWQKLLAYGEYTFTSLSRYRKEGERHIDLKNAEFNGWYATASYMILGEQRKYAPDDAEFAPSTVSRKGGKLELVGRVSHVNLNDFHDKAAPITGGSAYGYSVNLNWYPVNNLLVGLNYTFMDNDKYADDKGHITVGGKKLSEARVDGVDFHITQLRCMISF